MEATTGVKVSDERPAITRARRPPSSGREPKALRALEPAEKLLGVDAEALQKPRVLLVIDLLRQLLLCLVGLVVLSLLTQQLDDLLLIDLHDSPPSLEDFDTGRARL
jgi:hypothetical protein